MKQAAERNTRFMITEKPSISGTSSSVVKTFSPDNDECLRKVALWMKGEKKDGEKALSISNKELKSVFSDKFKYMVNNDREMFIRFLNFTRSQSINNVFHLLLPVYDVYPSLKLLWLVLEHCTETNYQALYDIPWHNVSFQTILAIVTNSAILEHLLEFDWNHEYKKSREAYRPRIYSERFEECGEVELIMLWALANPLQKDKIKQLLDTVCFWKIPQLYVENILLPSVLTIFPDITDLTCSRDHSDQDTGLQLMDMRVATMPGNIFFLQEFKNRLPGDNLYYELIFSPENKSSCISLHSNSNSNRKGWGNYNYSLDKSHSFILFDASKPHLPKYPLFVRKSCLSAIEGIVKCSKEFRFMFYRRTDE